MASVIGPSTLQTRSPYEYSLSEKRNRVHSYDRKFPLIGMDDISEPIDFVTKDDKHFVLTYLVQRASSVSHIPMQLVELLKLNSLCMSDSTLGSYVILRALINGKRCYDKFYVYRHCGEIRIGNKLAEKLGLERTSHTAICLPQTFEDHNPKVENFDLKVAKFNASCDGE